MLVDSPHGTYARPARRARVIRLLAGGLALLAVLLAATTASADWRSFKPPGQNTFFGVTDTGQAAGFRSFASAVGKHPAVIETYHPWGNSLHDSIPRWEEVRARPILHISTVDGDGNEIITPRGIAKGLGDEYLIRLNRSFARHGFPAYIRPLGEPNRCLNAYAGVSCSGAARGGFHSAGWYRQAFRRMYVILHGGGRRRDINAKLRRLGLPGLRRAGGKEPRRLPKAPVAVIWSPLPDGSPGTAAASPGRYYPGDRYVDWIGTDFYSRYPYWRDLKRFYNRYAKGHGKPFALTEWGVWGSDSPGFVRRIFTFARTHRHTRMLVYYQDFGSRNPFRIQNFPASRQVLSARVASSRYPGLAPSPPKPEPTPEPTGGIGN